MVPPQFVNFFIASASAGAALVGLLFVAVSIAPEHIVQANAPVERQAMAASSFTALLNAFFISFGALLPENVGYITLVMSFAGLTNSFYLTRNLLKDRPGWQSVVRRIYLILVSYIVYGFEVYYAILLIKEPPGNPDSFYGLTALLIAVYGIALLRAWQLLGARRYGLLGWLSPLHESNEKKPVSTSGQSTGSSTKPPGAN
jgi:hypothetical protein